MALAPAPLHAEDPKGTPATEIAVLQQRLQQRLQQVGESLEAVRRDQLNYRIEKDLLKEAYASNLQTINLVKTLILGTLTVVGFIGVRSIGAIRQEFKTEVEKLTVLRSEFERKFQEIDSQLATAQRRFAELATANEQQDQRLRILEIQEKAGSFLAQGNCQRALDYISVGLALVPTDGVLLRQQAQCLMKLGRLAEALASTERLLDVEPNDPSTISNAAELHLLNLRPADAAKLYEEHRDSLARRFGPYLLWYLIALRYFLEGSKASLRDHLTTQPIESPSQKELRIKGWGFAETKSVIAAQPASPIRILIEKAVEFLEGGATLEEFEAVVAADTQP